MDIEPINEGHVLIVPQKHYHDVDELDKETSIKIMEFSIVMTKVIKNTINPDGYTIMQNGGVFNDIGHYHMHIFPRHKDDEFGWKFGATQNSRDLNALKDKFKNKLNQQ